MKRTLLASLLGTMLLSACGSDKDTDLLGRPSDTPPPIPEPTLPALSASPLMAQMDINTTKNIDVTVGVSATKASSWVLSRVEDTNAFGAVANVYSSSFDYEALSAGVAVVDYTVADHETTASASVLVSIKDSSASAPSNNTPPLAQNVTDETLNNGVLRIDLNAYVSDIDGDALSIEHVISPSARFSDNGKGEVSYTPNGFVGVETAAYSVSDGRGGFDVAYVLVNSIDAKPSVPNTAPTANDIMLSFNADEMAHWTVDLATYNSGNTIFDADGDALSIERILADSGRVSFSGTSLTYTPEADFSGIDEFSYVISDGKGGYGVATVTVVVKRTVVGNMAPSAAPVAVSGVMDNEPAAVLIDVSSQVDDADGDSVHLAFLSGGNGSARISTSDPLSIEYRVPSPAQGLQDTFSYVVSDGKGGYAMSTVRVEMQSHNPSAPTATLGVYETTQDTPLSIDLSKYIHDNETQTADLLVSNLSIKDAPAGHAPSVSLNGQVISYTPNGFVGSDVLSYSVSDGELSASGSVVILSKDNSASSSTLNANDINVVIDVASQGMAAQRIDWLSEVSSDKHNAQFTLVSALGASLGSANANNNVLTYTPATNGGVDKFVYTVKDNSTPPNYAQAMVTVALNQPPAPQITALSASLDNVELSALVDCDTCDVARYRYQWIVNGRLVGEGATLPYRAEFDGFNIRLEVIGEDAFGQVTEKAHVVYEKHGVKSVHAAMLAFSALKTDGSIKTWGWTAAGAVSPSVEATLQDVKEVFSNGNAFVGRKNDGSFIAWGVANSGGLLSAEVTAQLSDVQSITGALHAFAALKDDGSVVTWGEATKGGDTSTLFDQLNGVISVAGAETAFAALRYDGSAVVWGSGAAANVTNATSALTNIAEIIGTRFAFAARKHDGTVVTWGSGSYGGTIPAATLPKLVNVKKLYANDHAFAALKTDGTVVAWGNTLNGGKIPTELEAQLTGVKEIISSGMAFAALKHDGSVLAWGTSGTGGVIPAEVAPLLTNITRIYSTDFAFAAHKADGSLIVWGDAANGGNAPSQDGAPLTGIKSVTGASRAFTALRADNSVLVWGSNSHGGNSAVQDALKPSLSELDSSL